MSNSEAKTGRPLSPHLQIYRWPITMTMSILHRVTGAALYAGTLLLAWWLIAAAAGPAWFDTASAVFGSWIGRLILFGYSWALIHHLLGGIRHFIWDGVDGGSIAAASTSTGTFAAWAISQVCSSDSAPCPAHGDIR